MKYLWVLFPLLLLPLLSSVGCASTAAYLVTSEVCKQDTIQCGKTEQDEKNAPSIVAKQAFKIDKSVYL